MPAKIFGGVRNGKRERGRTHLEDLVDFDETVLVMIELVDDLRHLGVDVFVGSLLNLSNGVDEFLRGDENVSGREAIIVFIEKQSDVNERTSSL